MKIKVTIYPFGVLAGLLLLGMAYRDFTHDAFFDVAAALLAGLGLILVCGGKLLDSERDAP